MKRIYLDNAATTKPDAAVIARMNEIQEKFWGNASSIHNDGQAAKQMLEESRREIAGSIGCDAEEVIFTSGGTEADNLAIRGLIDAVNTEKQKNGGAEEQDRCKSTHSTSSGQAPGHGSNTAGKDSNIALQQYNNNEVKPHVVTSAFEHHAVLDTVKGLEKAGFIEATYIKPNSKGLIEVGEVEAAIKENTVLVSIIYVNNEIGTVQPISEIGKLISEINDETRMSKSEKSNNEAMKQWNNRIYFHTDAVQAVEYFDINPDRLGVDLMTIAAHKFHGPKGVGALYVRKGTPLIHQMIGGGQERKKRAGTENVAGVAGMTKAMQIAFDLKSQISNLKCIEGLRNKLIDGILKNIPDTRLNGDREKRSPANVNISFINAEGESIILMLDLAGISASSGSACTSGSLDPSHVLLAMGLRHEEAHGSVRFTLGRDTTEEEIDKVLEVLPPIIERLRKMSPL